MKYRITVEGDLLRADLQGRTTLEEMRGFLRALHARQQTFGGRRILLSVRQSAALFRTNGRTTLLDEFESIAPEGGYRIALLGDSRELRVSHDYLAGLANRRHINLQSFSDEESARRWLEERRTGDERRATEESADEAQMATMDAEDRHWERRRLVVVRGEC
jgi:hypothetical protein